MLIPDSLWGALVYLVNIVTFSSLVDSPTPQQQVLNDLLNHTSGDPLAHVTNASTSSEDYPIFEPPGGSKYDDFECVYPDMVGWKKCSTPGDRGCWLKKGDDEFNITTNYEITAPKGITRKYTLNATDLPINADGWDNPGGKVFNGQYPGPWIQACWGDDLEITVINNLEGNGTTIHWHGIRQLNTAAMDGVNGVTQCPIAPGEQFTYKFKALQYGSTWYHSHYSVQYADGLLGPITIHGPSSADYDEPVYPLLMTDWLHQSAFDLWWGNLVGASVTLTADNILLNGTGQFQPPGSNNTVPAKFTLKFKEGKRYLLRLINTSVDTTFIFAIDSHKITVMSSDFVPIKPYVTDSVLVGIGQRYHVVVEAQPKERVENNTYWIRTIPPKGCNGVRKGADILMGIVTYGNDSTPTTIQNPYLPTDCSDEPYESLIPMVPWKVGTPVNYGADGSFDVSREQSSGKPFIFPEKSMGRWNLWTDTLWLDFGNVTLSNIDREPKNLPKNWAVVNQDFDTNSWVYLLVSSHGMPINHRAFPAVAHPIHLHGHDFAILQQSPTQYKVGGLNLKLDNPPRRDVALLPKDGFLVIAFKADNPGSWLMHCHIVWHASGGLALQILENRSKIKLSSEDSSELQRICDTWNEWNTLPDGSKRVLQDDSGI